MTDLQSWCQIMNKLDYNLYINIFLEQNSKINLISKKEEEFLFEKHIYDSLGIKFFFEKYNYMPETLLDIGTGGGFPSVPIALEYPEIKVTGIDSRGKKINAVKEIANRLSLSNLELINDRVENITNKKYDVITSRAVGKTEKLIEYAYPLLNDKGYIVLYKSKGVNEELDEAKNIIRKYHLKIKPLIEYKLPLKEDYTRVLVILEK